MIIWGREINHMATIDPAAPGENYSLLIIGVSNSDGDGGGVDSDCSGEIPRPGRVPEQRLLPPKLVFNGGGGAELFSGKAYCFRVFASGSLYGRKGEGGGGPRAPHHVLSRPDVWPREGIVTTPRPPSSFPLRCSGTFPRKYGLWKRNHPIPRIFS